MSVEGKGKRLRLGFERFDIWKLDGGKGVWKGDGEVVVKRLEENLENILLWKKEKECSKSYWEVKRLKLL